MGYEQEISVLREEIDVVDTKLIALFEARMRLSADVAELKQRYDKPVFDPERENAVIKRALTRLTDSANEAAARRFFHALMDLSKQHQHTQIKPLNKQSIKQTGITGYLGIKGSFSHIAACEAFGENAALTSFDTFDAMFEALGTGEIAQAILPAENTETGSITAVVDLLARYGHFIVAERLLKVSHSLLGLPGAALSRIETVYSHPEPIAQCSRFLAAHPHMRACPALSTAQAASHVAELGDQAVGCIASALAGKIYGLEVLAANVQNSEGNSTRFVVVAAGPHITTACDKTSIVFKVDHRPGSLLELLRVFSGINILKLESRPLEGRPFEYLFHLDFEGSADDKHVAQVLQQAKEYAAELIWLGSYPRAV